MLPDATTYSENGSKRRKLCPPAPLPMNRTSSAPTEPRGWWIGLTLNMNKQSLNLNQNNHDLPSAITATIHDYDTNTQESQIWIKHNDIYIMDSINLQSSPPPYISALGNIWENDAISIPPHNAWIPMKLELGCSVKINPHGMEGIIDGYDSRSRRYHISYSNNLSEWKWCTNNNTKLCNNNINLNSKHIEITAPPFDITPYGLKQEYIDFSNKMSMNETQSMKRTIDTSINIEHQPPLKRRKTALETEEASLHIRIPKMTEKITSAPMDTMDNDEEMENNTNNREIIDLLSSQSVSPSKEPSDNRNVIDLRDDDDQELHVGTAQYREYNRQLMRREKDKRRRHKKERRKSRKSRKGSLKYPRKVKINGVKWIRQYSASDKRYYWCQKNNDSVTSWNPFQDAGRVAPWLNGRSHWQQWQDQETKKYYYYNPLNNMSTFDRPCDYRNPEEILYDSAEDDQKRIRRIYNDPNNDNDVEVIGIVHPKPKHKGHKGNKGKRGRRHRNKPPKPAISDESSRRHQNHDPNVGGFSFFDVPTTEAADNTTAPDAEHDLSVLQAVSGLEDILNGNIKEKSKSSVSPAATVDSTGSVDIDAIFGVDGDLNDAERYDTTEIVRAVWKELEPCVRSEPKIKFNELISTHASGWNLDDGVINALLTEYNQTVVDIFQNSMMNAVGSCSNKIMDIDVNLNGNKQQSVWAQLDENLRSVYRSHNTEAIHFVLQIFDGDCDETNVDNEKKAKCLSILSQNSDNLVRIIKSDRGRFVDDITRILCGMISIDDDDDDDSMDIDVIFGAFNFFVMDEYFYSLIKYGKSNTEIIFMISKLSQLCIVYQLIGCMRIPEVLSRFNVVKLVQNETIFDDDNNGEDMTASMLLGIEALKLVLILTKGVTLYKEKRIITSLQRDCIEDIQRNGENYMLRQFAFDVIYSVLSSVLKHNLSLSSPNLVLFGVCCDILTNIITIPENETILLKILGVSCKRSKRIIYLLHKTYHVDDDNDNNNDDDDEGSPSTLLKRVIQPYEFKNVDDASFEAYGIELDVSQREDSKNLSNIDCRESIGDILLKYLQRMNEETMINEIKFKYLIGSVFYSMCRSAELHLTKVSWGYNKALNHYHRDNICIEWIKCELLYQHKLCGREHPDSNNQPQRHHRICSLIEILFNPLIWDYDCYMKLLNKLCSLCISYKNESKQDILTWKRVNNNNSNAVQCMAQYTSNLWNEIISKWRDNVLMKLLGKLCGVNECGVNVKTLCSSFESMLRNKSRQILCSRGGNIDNMVSLFLRSNTLHLLVGLTQMEATSIRTRNCARRAIRCIVWSVNDSKHKLLLKKSQLPFLPTIQYSYKSYFASDRMHYRGTDNILVVGDGNLSFGRALSRLFGEPSTKQRLKRVAEAKDYGARNIVVTCYESAMELLARYPHSGAVVAEIADRGGFVLYGIDATKLQQSLCNSFSTYGCDKRPFPLFNDVKQFKMFKYNVIIWNFPHAMNRSYDPTINGDLVEDFFISAKKVLARNGEIHITLHINHQIDDEIGKKGALNKTYRQYETWQIDLRAHNQQLRCCKKIELKHRLYPGYAIKNVQGNPFNIVKAEIYIFKHINDIQIINQNN